MYNRYIPGTNGVYERQIMNEPEKKVMPQCENTVPTLADSALDKSTSNRAAPSTPVLDLGDMLLLCIMLLLLLDSDQEDSLSILITAAAFLFLQ